VHKTTSENFFLVIRAYISSKQVESHQPLPKLTAKIQYTGIQNKFISVIKTSATTNEKLEFREAAFFKSTMLNNLLQNNAVFPEPDLNDSNIAMKMPYNLRN